MNMQKAVLYIIFLLSFIQVFGQDELLKIHHNKIDDIKSCNDLKTLVRLLDSSDFDEKIEITPYACTANKKIRNWVDSLGAKPYYKADFDGNGWTDILFMYDDCKGQYIGNPKVECFCIMDSGNNRLYLKDMGNWLSWQYCIWIASESKMPSLIYKYYYSERSKRNTFAAKSEVLTFKYGDFIEYNSKPLKYKIDSVYYDYGISVWDAWGDSSYPTFEVHFDLNKGVSSIINKSIGKSRKTLWKGYLNDSISFLLSDLVNYANFKNLDNHYKVGATDHRKCTLKVFYDKGKCKTITDYGMRGTHGLGRLYAIFYDFKSNCQIKNKQ